MLFAPRYSPPRGHLGVLPAHWSWRSAGVLAREVPAWLSAEGEGFAVPGGRIDAINAARHEVLVSAARLYAVEIRRAQLAKRVLSRPSRGLDSPFPEPPPQGRRPRHDGPRPHEPRADPVEACCPRTAGTRHRAPQTPAMGRTRLRPRAASTPNARTISEGCNYLFTADKRRGTAGCSLAHALLVHCSQVRRAAVVDVTGQPGPAIGPFHWTSRRAVLPPSYARCRRSSWLRELAGQHARPIRTDRQRVPRLWSSLLGLEFGRQFFAARSVAPCSTGC